MKVPKYYRVKGELLGMIADLPAGTAIETERELAERFGTSRTTVRQAIADLVVDGRLERTQGRGTFVARPKLMQVRPLTSFSQDLGSEGWRPGSVVLDNRELLADADVARHLQIPAGSPVHRVERVRTVGEERIAHEVAHLPGPLPGLANRLDEFGSLYRTLREVYGKEIVTVEDAVETVLADPLQANLLGVETGLPMLLVHRTGWDERGAVVEWTRSVFRGDRFRFVSHHRLLSQAGSAPDTVEPGLRLTEVS
ncbi:MAG TPA: GntR family transcriptional regulator [Arachnia sp.]|nr:GntR family transcriptional regulator [Arachnia sp.]HMT84982.1 GntR family transcriptional regulator [Arachnia sp.]